MVQIKNSKQQNSIKPGSPQKSDEAPEDEDDGLVDIRDSIERIMDKMTKSQMH